jgi:hypothetical protein
VIDEKTELEPFPPLLFLPGLAPPPPPTVIGKLATEAVKLEPALPGAG